MLNKKAQGISINTIIIAAIALIVLVVLITIFTGYTGQWGKKVGRVESKVCMNADARDGKTALGGLWRAECAAGELEMYPTDVDDLQAHAGQHCCK